MPDDWENGGFGIYIHWPFCEAKCPYCDFNSHVARKIDHAAWCAAYLFEIDRLAQQTHGRVLSSVFFGGGTPSLMDPETVAAVLERIHKHWPVANRVEVTLEANPSSVEATRFAAFKDAGVNRISMGIQALNDTDLRKLGRLHSAQEARAAFDIARRTFNRVSFDLIYARQDQSLDRWRSELREALSMAVDHLSLYQLTIEPGTAFGDRYRVGKLAGLPSEDLGADLFDLTRELCAKHGMPAYEVSNHAQDGAASRHNLIYWRYGDYLGIGPGAHGRVTVGGQRWATENWSNPQRWLDEVGTGSGEKPRSLLSIRDQSVEFLLMGLRLSEGIDLSRLEAMGAEPLRDTHLDQMQELGMAYLLEDRLIIRKQGFNVLNSLIEKLIVS
ncbi:MAG: radical SAM family heme chaperone HemW [Pseudomonadota bacterium]